MPGFNGKGPEGKGSQTGRGLGKCNPNNRNTDNQTTMDNVQPGGGGLRGRGRGFNNSERFGQGRGRRRGFSSLNS